MNKEQWLMRKRFKTRTNLIIAGVIAVILIALIIYFCVVWLPVIAGALVIS